MFNPAFLLLAVPALVVVVGLMAVLATFPLWGGGGDQ